MNTNLAEKTCVPCRGGIPPLLADEVKKLPPEAAGWQATEEHTKIRERPAASVDKFVTAVLISNSVLPPRRALF